MSFTIGNEYEGKFYFGRNGVGYVRIPEEEHAIEVPSHDTGEALHRDTVIAKVTKPSRGTSVIGEVLSVVKRDAKGHIGTYTIKGDRGIVTPRHRSLSSVEFFIPEENRNNAQEGNQVFVTIAGWDENGPVGNIDRVLAKEDHEAMMEGIVLTQGFDAAFPTEAEEEAHAIKETGMTDKEIARRRDMRDTLTFTIDPDDAKDFDDALSYKKNPDGTLEIGIHIADVAFFVRPGTDLDDEAYKRATSVYLVDRTIPMLPEVLSNDLCSLRPDEDKFAFSCIVNLNESGEPVGDPWFGRTVIRSVRRFTYDEAYEVMQDPGMDNTYGVPLTAMNALAKKLNAQRMSNGALALEKEEVRFVLDEKGEPIEVRTKVRHDAHTMIEEYMLMANRLVAKFLSTSSLKDVMIYRVHPKPIAEKSHDLRNYLATLGFENIPLKGGVVPTSYLRKLVWEEISDHFLRDAVSLAIARSMEKAYYTHENLGHYGLAFSFYTHFTSPIRRYPDLLVHRILADVLEKVNPDTSSVQVDTIESHAQHTSERERAAMMAERQSVSYTQARYMSKHVGEEFQGMITGLNERGFFVSELKTKAEGKVRLGDVKGAFLIYNDKTHSLVSRDKSKNIQLRVGDIITIEVARVDVESSFIDYRVKL